MALFLLQFYGQGPVPQGGQSMFVYLNGRRVWVELQEADSGGNSGGGDDKVLPADVVKAFENLLERKGGNANAVALMLFDENKELRNQKRQLEQQTAEIKSKLPAEGAVILTGDDASAWAVYKTLGKPDEVKQAIDERTQLQGKLQGMERETTLRTVAETVGYKASVLTNLDRMAKAEGKALNFELRDTTVDGKAVKVAYVKDGTTETPLTDYATTNWADFLPALTVPSTSSGTGAVAEQGRSAGTRYPAQHTGAASGGKPDIVAEYLAKQEAIRATEKNPLLRS